MTDEIQVVHEALRSRGWRAVTAALGVSWRQGRCKCPLHGGGSESFTFDENEGRLTWICGTQHCGAGDVLAFIEKLRRIPFREALAVAAGIAGVELRSDSELTGSQREARDREHRAYLEAGRKRESEPETKRELPPQDEVAAVWASGAPVTSDSELAAYLDSRAIPARQAASWGLLRVVGKSATLPAWARYRGRSWTETGHRLLVRTFDHTGEFRGLRAWRVGGDEETPKRLPPAGYLSKGLVCANALAVEMLRERYPGRFAIMEGESDWAVWACRGTVACVAITSGSWTQDFADRLAYGTELIVRTDRDEAGEKYARHIAETAKARCQIWRAA